MQDGWQRTELPSDHSVSLVESQAGGLMSEKYTSAPFHSGTAEWGFHITFFTITVGFGKEGAVPNLETKGLCLSGSLFMNHGGIYRKEEDEREELGGRKNESLTRDRCTKRR